MTPTTQTKKERADAKRQELIAWLAQHGGRQKWQVCRRDVPQHLQGVINGLVEAGAIIRYYKTGRSFTGKYKRCYLQLAPRPKPTA